MPITDISGTKFGRMTAIEYVGGQRKAWKCSCECGAICEVRGANLRLGKAKSCGCLKAEKMAAGLGRRHGMYRSRTHKTWESMVARCTRPTDPSYPRYGGAGIKVCERWLTFENFFADMGERPDGKTLDRIDGGKGYEPRNCRWATHKEQANNTKANRITTYRGEAYTVRELSDLTGVSYHTLRDRLKRGWPAERAVGEPVHHKRSKT